MKLTLSRKIMSALACFMVGTEYATAASFSFTGNFTQDDDVQFLSFFINAPSSVTIDTFSFGGGVNASGTTILAGGFAPVLTLWDLTGANPTDTSAQQIGDVTLSFANLNPGQYTLALTEFANLATGDLPGGVPNPVIFNRFGEGNFTGVDYGSPGQSFIDPDGNQRTNAWSVDILAVDNAITVTIPEPSTLALSLFGLTILVPLARRRSISQR